MIYRRSQKVVAGEESEYNVILLDEYLIYTISYAGILYDIIFRLVTNLASLSFLQMEIQIHSVLIYQP